MTSSPYTGTFFANQMEGSRRAAAAVVPWLVQRFAPQRVVDVGCGVGAWAQAFRQAGCEQVLGVDGDYVDRAQLQIPADRFCALELDSVDEHTDIGGFDLVVSLEVAEHLLPARAGAFVGFLTSLAPRILFSAAIPGQGGTHHVNEQWPSYWIALFGARGFEVHDIARPAFWRAQMPVWYRQNMLLFSKAGLDKGDAQRSEPAAAENPDVVHPELYLAYVRAVAALRRRVGELEHKLAGAERADR